VRDARARSWCREVLELDRVRLMLSSDARTDWSTATRIERWLVTSL
jgi:hypothetical protein